MKILQRQSEESCNGDSAANALDVYILPLSVHAKYKLLKYLNSVIIEIRCSDYKVVITT